MNGDPGMILRVAPLDAASAERWDAFVTGCEAGSFFHRAGWKRVIETSLVHDCHFLYAARDGRILAVLPLQPANWPETSFRSGLACSCWK